MSFPINKPIPGNMQILNEDALYNIFSNLNGQDTYKMRLVCQYFREFASRDQIFFPLLKKVDKNATLGGARDTITTLFNRYCSYFAEQYPSLKGKNNLFDQKLATDALIKKLLNSNPQTSTLLNNDRLASLDESYRDLQTPTVQFFFDSHGQLQTTLSFAILDLKKVSEQGLDVLLALLTEHENIKPDVDLIEYIDAKAKGINENQSKLNNIKSSYEHILSQQYNVNGGISTSSPYMRGDGMDMGSIREKKLSGEMTSNDENEKLISKKLSLLSQIVSISVERGNKEILTQVIKYTPHRIKSFIEDNKGKLEYRHYFIAMQFAADHLPYLLEKGGPHKEDDLSSFLTSAIKVAPKNIKLLVERFKVKPNSSHLALAMNNAADHVPYLFEKGAPIDNSESAFNTLNWAIQYAQKFIKPLIEKYHAKPNARSLKLAMIHAADHVPYLLEIGVSNICIEPLD